MEMCDSEAGAICCLMKPDTIIADDRPHHERWFYRRMYSAKVFELVCKIYRLFGRSFYRRAAWMIAWAYAVTQHGVRRTVRENLRLLQPDGISDADAKKVFTNFAVTIADYFCVGNIPCHEAEAWCVERSGIEHLEEARKAGHGAILATGHYGFFEFGALLIGRMGWDISVVTLSEPTAALTGWRAAFRGRWGAKTIEIGADAFSSLRILKVLEAGEFAAMLIDRPFGDFTEEVKLPGGSIPFSKSPALIAYMGDSPIVPVVVAGLPDGKYRMVAKPCVWPRRLGLPREEAIRVATQMVAASLVDEFARDPSQWYQFPPLK